MRLFLLTLAISTLISCGSEKTNNSELTSGVEPLTPNKPIILLHDLCIERFSSEKLTTLRRYFSGNAKWEVLQEEGKLYAIRKEKVDGKYLTSLNGFYSTFEDTVGTYQTRVIISFGHYYGFGNDESVITFTDSKDKEFSMIVQGEQDGSPGYSSNLIIKGKNINIEIFEQAKNIKRDFTQKTIGELNDELTDVLKYEKEIIENGVLPISSYYPYRLDSTYFDILDGMQPGIYIAEAGIRVDNEGVAYTKVFNNKTNARLSEDRITPKTIREIGWSKNGKAVFQYQSELTVYEGDWDHQYEARFEIWFKDKTGIEKKLAEKIRHINGWER